MGRLCGSGRRHADSTVSTAGKDIAVDGALKQVDGLPTVPIFPKESRVLYGRRAVT